MGEVKLLMLAFWEELVFEMNKQAGSPRGEAGQTLLEILLAFSVAILVMSAIVMGVSTSLSNAQYAKNQGLANSYAQEGMAVVRQIRDSSLNTFSNLDDFTTNSKYCISQDSATLTDPILSTSNCEKIVDIFYREVKFDHDSADCSGGSKATVTVSWSDSKCPAGTADPRCHDTELVTCFSNIDQKVEP